MSAFEDWENRFSSDHYVFGKEANTFLVANADKLPEHGNVLVVADGEGRNGVWLARRGLDVLSLDFSPAAQVKARALADEYGVTMRIERADVHQWAYPEAQFDVVVEIFTQFSDPDQRAQKWAGMLRALKPGGLLILQGYTPKQLEYGTGGPRRLENLYTRALLEGTFTILEKLEIAEEEREVDEGPGHRGMSALIGLTGYKRA
ncbi:class I SAM-dependent methyltransferase [Varunaivibrio sulfuroxidans]|uniref:Methyltransferase family protein n=1 Tax=Varunaivibrio sulfuroxidans TaxID=1773489 RepID=A0A4R3JE47_9PROT|nr:class I SAM-dependent methyltransferase [Varunaivibrio sulfuroxidans]TCS64142.1 methyltransferase family protein [Varunaivibrio sulfuroxidans]WES31411.1 class I SAM-dependent methyltransferase [Varunaivibrio sulfuroxidans]